MEWYYMDDGTQVGPVNDDAIKSLIGSGVIDASTPVWRDGMQDWMEAGRTELVLKHPHASRTPPPHVMGTAEPVHTEANSTSQKEDSFGCAMIAVIMGVVVLLSIATGGLAFVPSVAAMAIMLIIKAFKRFDR